jgi:hypothetical protein
LCTTRGRIEVVDLDHLDAAGDLDLSRSANVAKPITSTAAASTRTMCVILWFPWRRRLDRAGRRRGVQATFRESGRM